MESVNAERRMRRSEHQFTALRYQLESTLKRGRMAALTLTDQCGLVLAHAGEDGICEELGAVAPVVAHGWPPEMEDTELRPDDVSVRAIDCFGEPLYLASLGGGVARDALLAHSARGIHRILTAN
ncbi:MAG: hypothetical protein OXT09_27240 [Myxococcales bacterium]|nr:hypothetical protein [Myxococcales bacterium]